MKTLSEKQLALAKHLMKENGLTKIYAKSENGHMYSDPANALYSVGQTDLEKAIAAGLIIVVEADEKPATPPADEKPTDKWNVEKLKAYATEKKIELGEAKTKAEILAAINKALEGSAPVGAHAA